jgi:hypothetical protein
MRLGKVQVSTGFDGLSGDTWGGMVKDFINDAQAEISKEHDWSTLQTSGTFTTSSRTYDLSTDFPDFGREVSLVDTTNDEMLTPVMARLIDEYDPDLDDAGGPTCYAIDYPTLLFDRTPAAVNFRLRYFRRPTTLVGGSDRSILPEYCDLPLIWWAVWQFQASREDAQDNGENARSVYQSSLARAIGQDRRRMDQVHVLGSVFPRDRRPILPFPSNYPAV